MKTLIMLCLLFSTSTFAQDTGLVDAIKNTNLLTMKNKPKIRIKADLKAEKMLTCKNYSNQELQVRIHPNMWYAAKPHTKINAFCLVMSRCDKRISCQYL